MLHLMIMRHGKSDWDTDNQDDHDRPLSPRGVASSERMGEIIRELGLIPDVVISSTARRARSTAELARITGGWDSRLVLEDALYGASVADAVDFLSSVDDSTQRVMLVGHEPTWSMLVKHLTGAAVAMKTAAVADIELPHSDWSEIRADCGVLVTLLQARHFVPRS